MVVAFYTFEVDEIEFVTTANACKIIMVILVILVFEAYGIVSVEAKCWPREECCTGLRWFAEITIRKLGTEVE